MNVGVIVFHKPTNDKEGKLEESLEKVGAAIKLGSEVTRVSFSDGWLVFCYDETPRNTVISKMRDVISACATESTNEVFVFLHNGSDNRIKSDQVREVSNILKDFNVLQRPPILYRHMLRDKIYRGIVDLLEKKLESLSSFKNAIGIIPDAAISSLEALLPLDTELQLNCEEEIEYLKNCKKAAQEIEKQSDRLKGWQNMVDPKGETTQLMDKLLNYIKDIKTANSGSRLSEIFNGKREEKKETTLAEYDGFHKTLESLRDCYLKLCS